MFFTTFSGGAIWWAPTRWKQSWCSLQVELCDACLSVLKWFVPCKALYKCFALPFFTLSWKDKVTNEEVRKRTGQHILVKTISERRLHWLGHTIRMDHRRIPQQALYWEVPRFKSGPGRPRANWIGVVRKDLQRMGLTLKEAEVAALGRQEWRWNVAQCVYMDHHHHMVF